MMLEIVQKTGQGIRFYHPDHLGSTTVVTDLDGEVTQNVAYIPYGEVFVEQRNGTWNTPYLFNAKELDEETGLYYYGARYLDPTEVRWLSVDPVFHPGSSPYAYCLWNPIKMIDIGGMDEYVFNEDGSFSHKNTKEGEHYGFVSGKNISFTFADPVNDPKLVERKDFTGLQFISDTEIDNALWNSGVQDSHEYYSYMYKQSNANNLNGEGKMDYVVTANFTRGDKQMVGDGIMDGTKLYLSYSESAGYVAHNNYNMGNFLWGAGACSLGCPIEDAVFAAHYNNYFYDQNNKGTFDSSDDQFSIRCGYRWIRDHNPNNKMFNKIDDDGFKGGTSFSKKVIPALGKMYDVIDKVGKKLTK